MNGKTVVALGITVMVLLAGAAGTGFWAGNRAVHDSGGTTDNQEGADTAPAEAPPVSSVDTIVLEPGPITETLHAYGIAASDPANQQTVTSPYEGRVLRILVTPGQLVSADQPVADIEPSADVRLSVLQAQAAADAATRDVTNTKERFSMKLATNQELEASQNALSDAKLKLQDLKDRGATEPQTLKAHRPGIVSKADVSVGQVVPADGPVLEIDDAVPSQVRLGVEAQDAQQLTIGAPVDLTQVGRADLQPVHGKIHLIPPRVNPDSRLVDVLVSLPENTKWLLGSYVEATVIVGSKDQALVVPRLAVLPTDEGQKLFTVNAGKAVAHTVTIGLQTDQQYEIVDAKPPLNRGDVVVLTGNYELDDGMAVTTRPAP